MNTFLKRWITATLAPESIAIIKGDNTNGLYCIRNEYDTKRVFILIHNDKVQAIGKDYTELLKSPPYSNDRAIDKISEILGLIKVL